MYLKRLLSKEGRDQLAAIIYSFQDMYEEDMAVSYIYDGATRFTECTCKAAVRVMVVSWLHTDIKFCLI